MQRPSSHRSRSALLTLLLVAAVLVAFIPAAVQFLERGVQDVLFTGDGAALELGTLHAARGMRLVGPYSRFGWSHPGPVFFYLAAPVYVAFGHRGPALNLFALLANAIGAVALVLSARRLRSPSFAFVVAALLAVYALVAVPHLLTNEWNPVLPILPLALLSLIAVRIGLGHLTLLPAFAFIASAIIQTHIGYVPEVVALSAVAFVPRGRLAGSSPDSSPHLSHRKRTLLLSTAVLILCWVLPLYEAVSEQGGNLWQLLAFWEPKHLAQHSWTVAVANVFEGMAAMPLAIARTIRAPVGPPGGPAVTAIALVELALLVMVLAAARKRRDDALALLAISALLQIATAVVAVRAIRGEIHEYLIIWTTLLGFTSLTVLAAWVVEALERALRSGAATAIVGIGSLMLIVLAVSGPVPRGPVFRERDVAVEELARNVETYVRASQTNHPIVRIASRESWPTTVAVVLHLLKRGIPTAIESDWLFMTGKPLAARGTENLALLFGNETFAEQARTRADLTFVAHAGDVHVYGSTSPDLMTGDTVRRLPLP